MISEVIFRRGDARLLKLLINKKELVTPAFFPAISSTDIRFSCEGLANLISTYSYPRMLISAFDLHYGGLHKPTKMLESVTQYFESGGVLMLDSGGYESSWKGDQKWEFDLYQKSVAQTECDFFFGFDAIPPHKSEADEPADYDKALERTLSSRRIHPSAEFIPILHGSNPRQLLSFADYFENRYPELANVVGVAERDCGKGLFEKARTIAALRKLLDRDQAKRKLLHLLGCGSPSSLALYSYFGVDIFDSLDWTKFTLDERDWVGRDFSYLDVLNCDCTICGGRRREYVEKTLLHNLAFYQEFMLRIQSWIRNGSLSAILRDRLGHSPDTIVK